MSPFTRPQLCRKATATCRAGSKWKRKLWVAAGAPARTRVALDNQDTQHMAVRLAASAVECPAGPCVHLHLHATFHALSTTPSWPLKHPLTSSWCAILRSWDSASAAGSAEESAIQSSSQGKSRSAAASGGHSPATQVGWLDGSGARVGGCVHQPREEPSALHRMRSNR